MVRAAVYAIVVACLAACGGDGEPKPSQDAINKCEALKDALCTRYAACSSTSTTVREQVKNDCLSGAATAIDCSQSVDVSSSYDTCLRETSNQSCAIVLADDIGPPKSCEDVIISLNE